MGRRRSSGSALIRAILTGQPVPGGTRTPASNNSLLSQIFTGKGNLGYGTTFGGGLNGLATRPKNKDPLMIPQTSANAAEFGAAPPVLSGTTKHPVGSGVTLKDINKAAIAAIGAQYDPAIGQIGSEIAHTKHEGHKEKQQIKKRGNRAVGDLSILYGSLGRYNKRQQGKEAHRGHLRLQRTKQAYGDLNKQISENFDTNTGATAKELQRLGIDPSVALQGAAKDRAFAASRTAQDRAAQIQNTKGDNRSFNQMLKRIHSDILTSGLGAIGQSKAQTEAGLQDVAKQIADQVFQLRMQGNTLSAQKSAALASQHASMLGQRYTSRQQRRAARLDNQYKEAQIAHLLGVGGGSGGVGGAAAAPTDSVGKGLAFLERNAANLQNPGGLENILEYVTGGAGHGQKTPWDKKNYPQIWDALVKTGARHGWTMSDMKYLQRAVQIALGI